MKLGARLETNIVHKGGGTLIRGMRHSMQTAVHRQSLKKLFVENPQRKIMDSAFSTVNLRAADIGIKRRKTLKSGLKSVGN